MKRQLTLAGKFIIIGILAFLLLGFLFLWGVDYQQACTIILSASGKLHRQREFQLQYLTPGRFAILRLVVSALLILYAGASYFLYRGVNDGMHFMYSLMQWVKASVRSRWSGFTSGEKMFAGGCGVLLLLLKIYQAATFPIFYDEAWTYLNMSSKNVLVSMSYYPAPNNHILFSIITNLTVLLPLDPTFALRLPNLLLLPVCYLTILLVLREFFSAKVAILGATTFMTAYPVALYSVQARGYFLYIWLAVLSVYCTCKMIHVSRRQLTFLWILVNALGFYVMPPFLYLFASMSFFAALVYVWNKDWTRFKHLITAGAITGFMVLILYTPIFLISGVNAITNNSYVQKRSLADIHANAPVHFVNTGNWMMGSYLAYGYLVCASLLLFIVAEVFRNSRQRLLALAALVLLISPFFIVLLHKVIPFERTWSYCIFPLIIGLCFLVQRIRNYLPIREPLWYVMTTAVILANGFIFERAYRRNYEIDKDTQQVARLALEKGFHSFFIANDYQEVLFYYYYLVANQSYQVANSQAGAYPISRGNYDCLLINRSAAITVDTAQYKRIPVSDNLEVFARKPLVP